MLKAVHTFAGAEALTVQELEQRYSQLLSSHSAYLEYLKIGGGFAFFMDLAKHFFLSTTIEELHKRGARLVEEVMQHPELIWDQHGFVCRYGEASATVCHTLQKAYHRCEKQLRQLVDEAAIIDDVPLFRFKQWFLLHLAGERIPPADQDLPQALIDKANSLLFKTVKENQRAVLQYRQNVRAYMHEIRFLKLRAQLESLATNTLDLLEWIGARGLALRDLKPENLFVSGNPDDYPVFLNDSAKFTIGLIDVETAVPIDSQDPGQIPQPQLAGTPLYCTPTHLMTNTVLSRIYRDVREILHLQDWWAVMAIIFKIVTGENLFSSTARVFPEIISRLKALDPSESDSMRNVYDVNRLFWNSAMAEFRESMEKNQLALARIDVVVPAAMLPDFVRALHQQSDQIVGGIEAAIAGQPFFISETKRRFLLDASADKIRQMRTRLDQDSQSRQQREQALAFFLRLEAMKDHLQRKLEASAALKAAADPISADQVLEAMFQRVFSAMYLPHWPQLEPARWSANSDVPIDIATYQATL
jgi:serine/threonine protein kinase